MSNEPSTKPYLIRAIYEWCTDSGYTPYLSVSVDDGTRVPMDHVKNGEIVLNLSALATSKLNLGNELIEFQARFGGTARAISIPVRNVSAIYARENGHGMAFEVVKSKHGPGHEPQLVTATPDQQKPTHARQPLAIVEHPDPDKPSSPPPKGKTRLTVVK
jgi:stringent starvation protein B